MTSKRIAGRAASLMVLLAGTALAAPAGAETLSDALIAAYTSNPTLEAQRASQMATDEGFRQSLAGWLPSVSVSGSYSTGENRRTTEAPAFVNTSDSSTTVAITAQQNVFTGFRTYYDLRRSYDLIEAGRAQLTNVEQTVLFQAVAAYLDVLRDEQVLSLRENNVTVLTRQLEAANDRFRVGEITKTDTAQAEARLELARANRIQAEAQLTASRAAYARVIGKWPETLEPPPPLPPLPDSEEEALGVALQLSPALSIARETEEASRRSVAIAKGRLLPTVTLQATSRRTDVTNEDSGLLAGETQATDDSITAQLTMPLYQGGANYSSIRESQALNSRDRIRIAEAERNLREDVANAWESLRSARGRIASTSESVRASEIAYEGVQQEALVGSRTTLDVLDAEQELLDTRVALVQARRDEYVAAFNLLAVIGQLTAEDLGLPVEVYDPADYYRAIRFAPAGFLSLFR
ncbi:MAG: TolC family outer membrane protein [Alphaproteobacteria bacterium]|nr:TolC family outer membrane protein [Alphaproteobacteria bacterium]